METEKNKKKSILKEDVFNGEIDREKWYTPEEVEDLLNEYFDNINETSDQSNLNKN